MKKILGGQNATFDLSINYNPDTVIIAFGTNDYYLYHSVELVVGAAKDYLSLVLVPHLRKFYADSFLHPDDNGFGLYAENFIKYLTK